MKAAVISLGSKSSKMTANALSKYFDEVDVLSLQDMEVNIGTGGCQVLHEGINIKKYDCIYPKGSFKYAALLRAISTVTNKDTKFIPMKPGAFTICHDKLLTHLKLLTSNVPMPTTYITATTNAAKDILQRINYPIIMKLPAGTQGKGVMFADSYASASSMLDTLAAIRQPFIIQEYVESGGVDVRAIVVGDKVVAAMKRRSSGEDKRSNIHAGGVGESCQIDAKTASIAIKAAKAVGVEICGVDLLETARGPLVLEVNLSPGLQGITEASGVDVAPVSILAVTTLFLPLFPYTVTFSVKPIIVLPLYSTTMSFLARIIINKSVILFIKIVVSLT